MHFLQGLSKVAECEATCGAQKICSRGIASVFYSRGVQFEFRPGYTLPSLILLVVFH
jgi:hypothetical protein